MNSEDMYFWIGLLQPYDGVQCLNYQFKDKRYMITHSLLQGDEWSLCIRYKKGGYRRRSITPQQAFSLFLILNEKIKKV